MTRPKTVLVSLFSVYIWCTIAHATITIFDGRLTATASDGSGDEATGFIEGNSISTSSGPIQIDIFDGEAYSKNTIDWYVNGGETTLSFDTIQKRLGNVRSVASLYSLSLIFSANITESYELSGYYSVTDVGAMESGNVRQFIRLYDFTNIANLIYTDQWSANTHNEQFTIGEVGGDFYNLLPPESSLTGTLIAGHSYRLTVDFTISTSDVYVPSGPDSGASAVGKLSFKIGEIPEPSTALLLLFASLRLSIVLRRR
jgi:hypothetical protein